MKFIYVNNTIYNENLPLQPIPVHRAKNSFNIFVIGIPVELAVCFHILLLVRLCQISTTSVPGFPSDVCIWVQDSRCIGYSQRQTSCRELNGKYNGLDFFITKAHLYAKMSFEDELNCLSGGSCHPYYFALRSKEEMQ